MYTPLHRSNLKILTGCWSERVGMFWFFPFFRLFLRRISVKLLIRRFSHRFWCNLLRICKKYVEFINILRDLRKLFVKIREILTGKVCMHGPFRHHHPSGSIPPISSAQVRADHPDGHCSHRSARPLHSYQEGEDWRGFRPPGGEQLSAMALTSHSNRVRAFAKKKCERL